MYLIECQEDSIYTSITVDVAARYAARKWGWCQIEVVHQLTAGYVKVFFKGQAANFVAIEEKYRDIGTLIPSLEIQPAGKSVSISIPVDEIKTLDSNFESTKEAVSNALTIVEKLIQEIKSRGLP